MISNLKVVVFLFMLITATLSIDYCSNSLCFGAVHIACNNDGRFGQNCPSNARVIEFTEKLKDFVLNEHNKYRNIIALGGYGGYKKASRMATLTWNAELAKLAEYNVKTCNFAHDSCRNTNKYKYAGQNLALKQSTRGFDEPKDVIEEMTRGWFEEHKDANMDVINNFRSTGRMIGHFTQLVRDEAYTVGCSIVQYHKEGWYTTLYACDYSLTNMLNSPIYTSSPNIAGSGCKTGTNPQFNGLCSIQEIYDNEMFYKNHFHDQTKKEHQSGLRQYNPFQYFFTY